MSLPALIEKSIYCFLSEMGKGKVFYAGLSVIKHAAHSSVNVPGCLLSTPPYLEKFGAGADTQAAEEIKMIIKWGLSYEKRKSTPRSPIIRLRKRSV